MANRYGGSYRNGNGYGNFGPPPSQPPQSQQQRLSPAQAPQVSAARQRLQPQEEYDPYGDGYSSSASGGGFTGRRDRTPVGPRVGGGGGGGGGGSGGSGGSGGRGGGGRVVPRPTQLMYQDGNDNGDDGYDQYDGRVPASSTQQRRRPRGQQQQQYGGGYGRGGEYERGGERDGGDRGRAGYGSSAISERRIGQDALDRIRSEWPTMCQTDCVPVQMALQLLDSSSVGRAHEYRAFQRAHQFLQDSLKAIVHDYHQGFNSSIGTFHKIQSSIQASQKTVRGLKVGLAASRASLCRTDPELAKLYAASQQYDDLLQTLGDLDDLRQVPERLEARISEKQFLTAVDVLQNALRKLRRPELDAIGALADLRSYLANQETTLMDILVEELHEHLYLKSPYCQKRWQTLAKHQGGGGVGGMGGVDVGNIGGVGGTPVTSGGADVPVDFTPFFVLLDSMDLEHAVRDDPARNPESDTFYYITLVVESLNKLGRLEAAVDRLKQRLPVELFAVVHETVDEIDQKHPSSLRGSSGSGNAGAYGYGYARDAPGTGSGGGSSGSGGALDAAGADGALVRGSSGGGGDGGRGGGGMRSDAGLHIYGSRETQMRTDVIYDLLWTLYGKFEAIAEGHRIFHEYIKALIRREGAGNNSALLGSFKELWNLYQNEIRSLLHNYVTTDADLYRSGGLLSGGGGGGLLGGGGSAGGRPGSLNREHLFKLNEADAKSIEMASEYEALDGIIRAAVPGFTNSNGAAGGAAAAATAAAGRGGSGGGRKGTTTAEKKGRRGQLLLLQQQQQAGGYGSSGDIQKPLVEPSVFNMSLLLPPTLVFLQRLRGIVPPGSDLAASTLTSFLDNFLVNVFQPQLEETLGKLSDAMFGEVDAFQASPMWSQVARRPVFKGTTAFFAVVTSFCRMLGTIPHDQALSALIIRQMMRYYDRCFSWYKALVTKTQVDDSAVERGSGDVPVNATASSETSTERLRLSAVLALEGGEIGTTARALWAVDEALADGTGMDATVRAQEKAELLQKEVDLLLARAAVASPQGRLGMSDVISDRDAITSLCLLYTSMKWLAVKIGSLRHITQQDADAGGAHSSVGGGTSSALARPEKRRWTLLNSESGKALADVGPVYLPMTQETVHIVSSYEELAATALLTLHLEVRCRITYALGVALSPEATAPYLLDHEVSEPDPQILALNSELIAYDETVARCLVRAREVGFVRQGLGRLVNSYLVGNARMVKPMNSRGCGRMQLNILVLQQNLKNVEDGVDLARAANYYALFDQGPDAIVTKAQECKERRERRERGDSASQADDYNDTFTYDELKELLELCYSEQLANPERGIENAARRQMGEKLMELGEHLWQM